MTRRVRGPRGAARPAPMPVNHRCPPSHVARLRSTCAFVEAQVTEQDPQHPTRYRRSQDSSLHPCVSPGPQHRSTHDGRQPVISYLHPSSPPNIAVYLPYSILHPSRKNAASPTCSQHSTGCGRSAAPTLPRAAPLTTCAHLPGIPHQGFTHARPTKRIMYKICAHVHPSMLAHTLSGALPPMARAFHPVFLSTGVAGTRALIMPIFHLVDLISF